MSCVTEPVKLSEISTSGPSRHRDEGRWLGYFLGDHCDVYCPRCRRIGVVRYEWIEGQGRVAKFVCVGCSCALKSSPAHAFDMKLLSDSPWFGRVRLCGSRVCGYCGTRWLRRDIEMRASELRADSYTSSVVCPNCRNEYPLTMEASRIHDTEVGCEPVFGMVLARSEPVMSCKTIWAYNSTHLDELRRFVSAQLRERRVVANSSFVSRLPTWMKSRRNRNKVLAAIGRIDVRMARV